MNKEKTVWIEIIPTMCGSSTGYTEDEDGKVEIITYPSKEGVLADIQEMHDMFAQQKWEGTRDQDDEYEGYAAQANIEGDFVHVFDDDGTHVESFNWRENI